MFLPWFGLGGELGEAFDQAQDLGLAPDVDTSANAWESFSFIDIVLFVTVIVAVAFGVAGAMARDVALPVAASAVTAGLGILSVVLIAYRLLDTPYEASRKFGVFLGLVAAIGVAYGGWIGMQEEGTSFGDQVDRVQGGGTVPPPSPARARRPPPGGRRPRPPPVAAPLVLGAGRLDQPVRAQAREERRARRPPPGGRPRDRGWRPNMVANRSNRPVIDREQVLHVARLARLELTDDEIERMTGELSGILEHVDRIAELDLDAGRADHARGRARERPAPGHPRAEPRSRAGARERTGPGRRRLSRPLAAGVSALRELSAAEAIGRIDAGELSGEEYFDAYAEAAQGDDLNAFLWRAEPGDRGGRGHGADAWRPDRGQGPVLHRGGRDHRRLAHPRGLPAPVHGHGGPQAGRGRRPAARQDQHGRVRDGLVERELGLRPGGESVGPRPGAGRLLWRVGRRGRRPARALGDRHRHRRLDPPAGGPLRDRRPQAHLRGDLALRDGRLRILARPVRAVDPDGRRRRPVAAGDAGPGPARLDLGRDRRRGRAARCAPTSRGCASASPATSPTTPRG